MKTIKSVDVKSFVLYGAVLAALWTFAFGLYYWILGWIFGAQSWWIDMNLLNWSVYGFYTFLAVFWRSLINALGGALGGLVVALVYNAVAGMMGGVKVNLEQ
jgi:ABC-type Fe3+ transport system permease subunit